MPASALINSITRCEVLPGPDEAWASLSGWALAAAISSGKVRKLCLGLVTTTCGNDTNWVMGVKSLTASYGSLANKKGLIAMVPGEPSSRV